MYFEEFSGDEIDCRPPSPRRRNWPPSGEHLPLGQCTLIGKRRRTTAGTIFVGPTLRLPCC